MCDTKFQRERVLNYKLIRKWHPYRSHGELFIDGGTLVSLCTSLINISFGSA